MQKELPRKLKTGLRGALALAGVLVSAPAFATTNLFTPITGSAFVATTPAAAGIFWIEGGVGNEGTSSVTVEASLGHAGGGTNGFTVYGTNFGSTLSCSVVVTNSTNGGVSFYSNSTTATGVFNFFIETTPAAGDYFYSIICTIPPGSSGHFPDVFGVKPDH